MERGRGANLSVRVWMRATHAVGADLHAYLEATSGAERPRDAVHLRHQELLAQYAARGQWKPMPEARTGNGFVDMVLERHAETAVVEVWDWLADVGDAFRSWDRKLEQWRARVGASGQAARVAGIWVVRASRRNHRLVHDHPAIFRARFPASGAAWLAALTDQARPMPPEPALIWVSVRGDRLYPARL